MISRRIPLSLALCSALTLLVGCGGGSDQMKTAKVTGKVTYDGAPVTGGSLTFSPTADNAEPGKAGSAVIGSDGTYSVSTYGSGDGAVIGKHILSYSAPPSEGAAEGEHGAGKPSPFAGLKPKPSEVVVESGGSTIDIELVK